MTIKNLKEIIQNLPDSTVLALDATNVNSILVEYLSGGRINLIFSVLE